MNIFEQASRLALRFDSSKGQLTTEQLWDLPLTSRHGFDLDSVAKAANGQLKALTEESFVQTKGSPQKAVAELRLELVKHVIAVRLQEAEDAKVKADKAVMKQKLLDALANKQDAELAGLSTEELQKRIAEL